MLHKVIFFAAMLLALTAPRPSSSQPMVLEWQKTVGGNNNDLIYSIIQTTDGGYILGGTSASNISGEKTDSCRGDYDFWIVKTDAHRQYPMAKNHWGKRFRWCKFYSTNFGRGLHHGGNFQFKYFG